MSTFAATSCLGACRAATVRRCSWRCKVLTMSPALARNVRMEAKKKGGNKKGQQKKGSLLDIPKKSAPQKQPYDSTDVIMSTLLLVESFKRIVGRIIHPSMDDVDVTEASKRLYCAEFCVLFVDDEGKLSYVNEPAQKCLGLSWEDVGKDATEAVPFLASVSPEEGKGRECPEIEAGGVKVLGACVWDVVSPSGDTLGTAATWEEWERDGVTLSAANPEPATSTEPPTQEEVDAAKKAVEQQAEAVRELKEVKGLANCDPEVQAAVEVLLERKAVLGELEERLKGAEAP